MNLQQTLRQLPSVHSLLDSPAGKQLIERYGHRVVADEVAHLLDQIRQDLRRHAESGAVQIPGQDELLSQLQQRLFELNRPRLRRVVNASGVILHTNLGRAPLAESALYQIEQSAAGYSNLEFNLQNNQRGSRHDHIEPLLVEITGAEAAMAVNNNAAAVLLVLSAMASGKEVVISRGELVEIGGAFRIPDVMQQSGARLVEVGTTNKTYVEDYRRAIGEHTALLLKVHTSNYRIIGFTHEVTLEELVQIGHEHGLPVMHDLGSGSLLSLRALGLPHEPSVQEAIEAGADLVTFSGDKLLGGPQAGIICGKAEWVQACKKHPLARALRIDKLTLAALEETLRLYRNPQQAMQEIPVLKMLCAPEEELHQKSREFCERLQRTLSSAWEIELVPGESRVGGGALPEQALPTWLIQLHHQHRNATELQRHLLSVDPPILTRILQDRVHVDPRTLIRWEEESEIIIRTLQQIP